MSIRRLAAALALAGVLSACSNPPYKDVPNPLVGTISNVETSSGRFEVTTPTGERYLFLNANPDDARMGTAHLFQHRIDSVPVSVTWRRDGYELVAVRIEDGPQTSPSPTFSFPTTQPS